MHDIESNSDCIINYNLLYCHACLSSNRKLTMIGDYIDVYRRFCDNSRVALSSQLNLCWECMALLKKVRAFKKKVDNAQKILDYCVNKQAPLLDTLTDLTVSHMENTTFTPILKNDEIISRVANIKQEPEEDFAMNVCIKDVKSEVADVMFKIQDVRGHIDIKPSLELPAAAVTTTVNNKKKSDENIKIEMDENIKIETDCVKSEPWSPGAEAERRHCTWKRSVMLVYKRLVCHKYARHFLRPVTDELAPHYSRAVRRPMDLSTIRNNIRRGLIRTTAEFQRDLFLMFSNAFMYNSSEHAIFHMARELQQEAQRELSMLISAQAHSVIDLNETVPSTRRRRRDNLNNTR